MSHLNTLAGGYKGGSPRVQSENTKPPFKNTDIKKVNVGQLINQIKMWHADGNLTTSEVNNIITQLQTIV